MHTNIFRPQTQHVHDHMCRLCTIYLHRPHKECVQTMPRHTDHVQNMYRPYAIYAEIMENLFTYHTQNMRMPPKNMCRPCKEMYRPYTKYAQSICKNTQLYKDSMQYQLVSLVIKMSYLIMVPCVCRW